jgi:hypothetical protein
MPLDSPDSGARVQREAELLAQSAPAISSVELAAAQRLLLERDLAAQLAETA